MISTDGLTTLQLIELLAEMRAKREEYDPILVEIDGDIAAVRTEIEAALLSSGTRRVDHAGLVVRVESRSTPRITNEPALRAWLAEHGMLERFTVVTESLDVKGIADQAGGDAAGLGVITTDRLVVKAAT